MNKITEQLKKIGEEIDAQNEQIINMQIRIDENKKLAVSEIFETSIERNAIDIAHYREDNAKLKNALSVLTKYRDELKQQAITIIQSI